MSFSLFFFPFTFSCESQVNAYVVGRLTMSHPVSISDRILPFSPLVCLVFNMRERKETKKKAFPLS